MLKINKIINSISIIQIIAFCIILWLNFNVEGLFAAQDKNDVIYYYDFCQQFPLLYVFENYPNDTVVYMPHFFLVFYLLTFLDVKITYAILEIMILASYVLSARIAFKININFGYITSLYYIITTVKNIRYGNFELLVFVMNLYILYKINDKGDYNWKDLILLAIFSFKIISLAIVLPISFILYQNHKSMKKIIVFIIKLFSILLIINLWWIILNFDHLSVAFFLGIIEDRPNAIHSIFVMLCRVSLIIPSLYFIYLILYKLKQNHIKID